MRRLLMISTLATCFLLSAGPSAVGAVEPQQAGTIPTVSVGRPLNGVLDSSDGVRLARGGETTYEDRYAFNAEAGQRVRLTVERLSGGGASTPQLGLVIGPAPRRAGLVPKALSHRRLDAAGDIFWMELEIVDTGAHSGYLWQSGNGAYRLTLTVL